MQVRTSDSLVLNNSGPWISPTAANTLTIDGELASVVGSVKLNATAAGSDVVLVNGAASGITQLEAKLAGAPLFDSNGDGVITANEGVLRRSFPAARMPAALRKKAAMSHQGRGNTVYTASHQVAMMQPAARGIIDWRTSSCAKTAACASRQKANPDAVGSEMFIRYIGSNLKYQTSQSVSNYGYDFGLDYSAVQLGGNVIRVDGADSSLRGCVAYMRGNTRIAHTEQMATARPASTATRFRCTAHGCATAAFTWTAH